MRQRDPYAATGCPSTGWPIPRPVASKVYRLPSAGATTYRPEPELCEVGESVSPTCLPELVIDVVELFRR